MHKLTVRQSRKALRVYPSLCIGFWFVKKVLLIKLSDQSYGQFVLLEDSVPKFDFDLFDENGSPNAIGKIIIESKEDSEEVLLQILKSNGFSKAGLHSELKYAFQIGRSYLKSFEILKCS